MGLDIHIGVNNYQDVYDEEHYREHFHDHSLSRPFCWLINRREIVSDVPSEIEQICALAGVDGTPLFNLSNYQDEEELEEFLPFMALDGKEEEVRAKAAADREALSNNIDLVTELIDRMVDQLADAPNLSKQIRYSTAEPLDWGDYFDNFNSDAGDGYIGNDFGQDLRNLQRFLHYAKGRGTKTVYFRFG